MCVCRLLKCKNAFPEHHIELGACHNYEIDYKYQWECQGCGYLYKRHSKSIDVLKSRCSICKGVLVQILPKPRGGGAGAVDGGSNKAAGGGGKSGYQIFMKERFPELKKANPGVPQKELMRLMGVEWRAQKEVAGKKAAVEDGVTTKTTTTAAGGLFTASGLSVGSGLIVIDDSDEEAESFIDISTKAPSPPLPLPRQSKVTPVVIDLDDDEDEEETPPFNLEKYLSSLKLDT